MMFKKAEGPLQGLLISALVVSFVAFAAFNWLGDISVNYGVGLGNESSFTVFNQYQEIANHSETIRNTISQPDGNFLDIVDNLFTGAWNTLKLFLISIPETLYSLVNNMGNAIGVPMLGNFLAVALIIVIAFAILALIMKVRA